MWKPEPEFNSSQVLGADFKPERLSDWVQILHKCDPTRSADSPKCNPYPYSEVAYCNKFIIFIHLILSDSEYLFLEYFVASSKIL